MSGLLESQLNCTSDHSDIVALLLGIRKFLDDVALRVEAETADPIFARGGDTKTANTREGDKEVILALLGLLSLRRTLDRWLSQCANTTLSLESVHPESPKLDASLLR